VPALGEDWEVEETLSEHLFRNCDVDLLEIAVAYLDVQICHSAVPHLSFCIAGTVTCDSSKKLFPARDKLCPCEATSR
jgi:hypothetical protein